MRTFLLGLIGALIGAAVGSPGTLVLGFAVGALWGQLHALSQRMTALERSLREREARAAVPAPPVVPPPPISPVARPEQPLQAPPAIPVSAPAASPAAPPRQPDPVTAGVGWIVEFFTTGNLVVKVGVVILFFGVAFLVRFAADRGLLPIEYRLMGVTAGALVLLGVGWRLRRSQPEYATALQGGAVGILYLTIFAAFRLYELLPALLTFTLLLLVVVLSGVLAVLQEAMVLAVLGTSGGFLAPILASTGSGSHVGLFSYYLLLNMGVVGLAWFRSWRLLNWLGFMFTFGIGLLWGTRFYQPEFFRTTEPFLIVFFLFYIAVAVLFAHRQPPHLRGYIDGSLVFGTPAIAFAMQSALVRDIAFGRAYSAVVVSGLYLALARGLWRRDPALRPLGEAFLALGMVFLTLAIPFAFDGHATATAWALEGAGLVWVGVRQQRVLARAFATMLQLGAGLAFAVMAATSSGDLPMLNSTFLGQVAIAAGGIASALQYFKARHIRKAWEAPLEWVLLVWGLLWWSGAAVREIERFVDPDFIVPAIVLAVAATGFVLATLAKRWEWPALMHATAAVLPLLGMLAWTVYVTDDEPGPMSNFGWLAWPVALAASYALLWRFELVWPPRLVRAWQAGTAWLLAFLLTWTAAAAVGRLVPDSAIWGDTMWAVTPSIVVLLLLHHGHRLAWPVARFDGVYRATVTMPLIALIAIWILWASSQSGSPAPLSYVPLANPLEIAQVLGLITIYAWRTLVHEREEGRTPILLSAIALVAFLALNASVGRVVHFYLDVPYDLDALADSAAFQTGISVLWALTALSIMTVARRTAERHVWFVGAGLLGLLTLKLFLVDLGDIGGIARIVSFLVTGVLILVIGYLSPLPPKPQKAAS